MPRARAATARARARSAPPARKKPSRAAHARSKAPRRGARRSAASLAAAFLGARQVYFLGGDEGGRVALYRGLPYDLPLGIELYSERRLEPGPGRLAPAERQDAVTDHELRSEDDAARR